MIELISVTDEEKREIDLSEIDWLVKNLSFYFADQSVIEPIAITRAMTVLLRLMVISNHIERQTKERRHDPDSNL